MARSRSSRAWLHEHVTDAFVQRARREGYRSRSAYKLLEIARHDRLLARGMTVVDLGAAPGGWSQVAAELVGPQGRVIAVDVLEMSPVPGATFIHGDFREEDTRKRVESALRAHCVDLVVSDMAPNISGISMSDQARALQLAELALDFASKWLKPGGNLLLKMFQGAAFGEVREQMRGNFLQLLTRKPQASRGRSSEVYLLGRGRVRNSPAGGAESPYNSI